MVRTQRGERHVARQHQLVLPFPVGEGGELPSRAVEQFGQPGHHPSRCPVGGLTAVAHADGREKGCGGLFGCCDVDAWRSWDEGRGQAMVFGVCDEHLMSSDRGSGGHPKPTVR